MMRISREEESYIGRARTNMTGRAKVGFAKDGRITALDLFIVQDSGAYGPMGDFRSGANAASLIYQPGAMRVRAVNVLTNTPPRTQQRSPGPMQANGIMEPVLTKAAKQLGLDQVAIRHINSPEGKAVYGPPLPERPAPPHHQRVREAGARPRQGGSSGGTSGRRRAASGARDRRSAASASPSGRTARAAWASTAIMTIRPDGKLYVQSGVGNLGHALGDRPGARGGGHPGDAVGEGRSHLGQHRQAPAVDVPVGGQPDHARDDARQLRRRDGRQAQAAGDRGDGSRRQRPTTTSSAASACSGAAVPAAG